MRTRYHRRPNPESALLIFCAVIVLVLGLLMSTCTQKSSGYDALTSHHYNTFRVYNQYYIQRVDNYNQVIRSLNGTVSTRTRSVYTPIYPSQRPVIGKNHFRVYP
jgi:hypothetical protein